MATTQRRSRQNGSRQQEKKEPVATFGPYPSSGSLIEVAIWLNESEDDGRRSYGVSFKRAYRDGDQWKDVKSLRAVDVPVLIQGLQHAYQWCAENPASDR